MDKAYKLLLDGEQKKRAVDVIHAGKEYVEHNVSDPAFTIIHTPQMYVLTFTFIHLADAFIQSDFQERALQKCIGH